jgi:F-box-like
MVSASLLHSYVNSNDPLPDPLRPPLNDYLDGLDAQWEICQQDKKRVENAIASRLATIDSLNREIEALSRVQSRTIEWQGGLEAKKQRYLSSIAAVRRIPPEVVAKFIKYAIEDPDGVVRGGGRLVFSQLRAVCRLWRQTALTTPSLWRSVGVDMSDTNTKASIWTNLTSWFLRAGEAAPLILEAHQPSPSMVLDLMDFVRRTGFNFSSLVLSATGGSTSPILLPYTILEAIASPSCNPVPLEYLGIAFRSNVQSVNPLVSRIHLNLNHCFPKLFKLSLGEAASAPIPFPVKISHETLSTLYLLRLKLSPMDMRDILLGLPRLRTLQLEECEGIVGDGSAAFTHLSLTRLILSKQVPEACLNELTCPALSSVIIEGPPPYLPQHESWGQMLGQFLKRRGGRIPYFSLRQQWPARFLENIIVHSHTALEVINVAYFSSFFTSSDGGESRFINISASSLRAITIHQEATEAQLVELCEKVVPPDGGLFIVDVPNCEPTNMACFPWPRREGDRQFGLGFCPYTENGRCVVSIRFQE